MVASVSRARQWLSLAVTGDSRYGNLRRLVVVVVCLSAPVAGATGEAAPGGLSTEANGDSIGSTESGVYAQTGPLVAAHGSVTINETRTNRTQVVLDSVTLPRNGYIVAQTGNVSANQSVAVVGHTQYVRNGTFESVVLELNETVDKSKVSVTLYNDSNGDETLNITGNGTTDAPYRTANGTPIRDSVQIGANGSENGTQSQNTTSTNATVEFANQTTNGSTVTVQSVTLPTSGFVVLDSTGPAEEGILEESAIAVSQRLSAGTHRNVTLRVNRSPPGGLVNRSTLNHTGTYEVVLYQDSNNNSRFEYITSERSADKPFIIGSGSSARLAADGARITIPQPQTPTPTASIRFTDQSVTDSTVTVRSVTLPDGGFVVIHDGRYSRGGDPLQTIVGHSRYLPAGTHRNVSVVLSKPVQQSQTFVAIPSRDTNGNQTYDYVRSDGFQDVPYTDENGPISARASVSTSEAATTTPAAGSSHTPSTAPSTQAREAVRGSNGGIDWLSVQTPIALALVLIGGYLLVRIRR
jgi:hypothetical protein